MTEQESAHLRAHDDRYVARAGWLTGPGRTDLIDCVADEFERRRTPAPADRVRCAA